MNNNVKQFGYGTYLSRRVTILRVIMAVNLDSFLFVLWIWLNVSPTEVWLGTGFLITIRILRDRSLSLIGMFMC